MMMFMLLTINALVWLLSRYLTLLKVSSLKNTNTPPFTRSHPSFPSTFPACHGWKQGKHFTYKYKAHHLPQLGSIHTRFVKIVAFKERIHTPWPMLRLPLGLYLNPLPHHNIFPFTNSTYSSDFYAIAIHFRHPKTDSFFIID